MVKSMNVAWWVKRWAELHPDKPAIIFEGNSISYKWLNARVIAAARWLQDLGIEKGDRVAVLLGNCPEFVELYLACAKLGAIFVPLNFRLAAPELDYILKDCRPRLFAYDERFAGTVGELPVATYRPPMFLAERGDSPSTHGAMDYAGATSEFESREPSLPPTPGPADPEEPQVIMYTSGTTGRPKGAVLSHRKTFFNCLNAEIFFKLSFDDVMLVILPLFHSGGLFIMASPCLYKGATVVIHPRFSPSKTFTDIEKYRVTSFLGVPTIFRELLKTDPSERGDISSLKVCAIGGEKVTPELVDQCAANGFAVRQIMGQTETSILLWASEEEARERPGTVGRPVFHAEVKLVDAEGNPVPQGEVGEIVARGPVLMKEYWCDPVKTEETIKDGWLRTGDLARQDEDGFFYLVDRAKDMFISGGENVYPAEIEQIVSSHPAVADVAVIGVPDGKWGETGHMFCVLKAGGSVSAEELLELCRSRLAKYKVPRGVTFCKELPKTALGKVRKFQLREMLDNGKDAPGM